MNREKFSYYGQTSPHKSSPSISYPLKGDSIESHTKQTKANSFLNDSKENMQPSMAGGVRDVLLMKCKQAIEELHLELEGEKRLRQQIEESLIEAENEAHEKESELREIRFKFENISDEFKSLKAQNETLKRELDRTDDQIKMYSNKESGYIQLQADYQNILRTNSELKGKIEDMGDELENRNKVIKQWNETLGSVQHKIVTLEKENFELKEEYHALTEENGKLHRIVEESENTSNLLQEKYEAVERLVQQLQRENKVIDNLRDQNETLRDQVKDYQRNFATINEESHVTRLELEERFFKEKEALEEDLKEKNRKRITEIQDSLNSEIFRLKEAHETVKNELFKVKSERDVLKQEAVRLEDRLEKTEFESRKLSGTFANNYESLVKGKSDEIERLKGVIDEQAKLLATYEKMVEKEKIESLDKTKNFSEQNNRLKDETNDLKTKNEYLNNKLRECQEELNFLKSDVQSTFTQEEEKQHLLLRKVGDLESELLERNTQMNTLNAHLDHLKNIEKQHVEEINSLNQTKKELDEELSFTKNQMAELLNENDELRDKQKDFYEILQGKINTISDELKQEREKKIQAQNLCKTYEERIFQLEGKLRGQKRLNTSVTMAEKSHSKYEPSESQLWTHSKRYYNTPAERSELPSRSYNQPDYEPSRQQRTQEHEQPIRLETRETAGFNASKRKGNDYSFDQKSNLDDYLPNRTFDNNNPHHHHQHQHHHEEDALPTNERGTPEKVHYQFVNRFKSVIEKLENKLERITADIDSATL